MRVTDEKTEENPKAGCAQQKSSSKVKKTYDNYFSDHKSIEDQSSLWLDDFDLPVTSMIDSRVADSFLSQNGQAWGVVGGGHDDEGLGRDDVWTGVFQDWSLDDDEPAGREENVQLSMPFDVLNAL